MFCSTFVYICGSALVGTAFWLLLLLPVHTTRWRNLGSDLASFAVLFIPDCVRGDIREKEVGVVARGEQTTQK